MSDSVRPHRRQPTRLPRPWDSPGKNTGVGCHFLLQRMKVKSESEVTQSCLTLRDPMDCSLPGSSAAFSKSSLNIWKFTFHVLLKPGLENLEHYFTSVWDENLSFLTCLIGEGNGTPLQYSCLENPWTGEPCRLQSMGSLRVGHN